MGSRSSPTWLNAENASRLIGAERCYLLRWMTSLLLGGLDSSVWVLVTSLIEVVNSDDILDI